MSKLNDSIIERIGDVIARALLNNETGVVEWAERAIADARSLDRLRDRDMKTLTRLEGIFSRDFYKGIVDDNRRTQRIFA